MPIRDSAQGEHEWRPRAFFEMCAERQVEPGGRRASRHYLLANVGGLWDLTGDLWECCPMWFSRYAGGLETEAARRAIEIAVWLEAGDARLVLGDDQPSARMLDLVGLARRINAKIDRVQQERAIEAAKRK